MLIAGRWITFLIYAPHVLIYRRWGWAGIVLTWSLLIALGALMGVSKGLGLSGQPAFWYLVGAAVVVVYLVYRANKGQSARATNLNAFTAGSPVGTTLDFAPEPAARPSIHARRATAQFGPNGLAVAAFIEQCRRLTGRDFNRINAGPVPKEMLDAFDNHFDELGTLTMSDAYVALSEADTATRVIANEFPGRREMLDAAHSAVGDAAREAWLRALDASNGKSPAGSPWEYAVHAGDAIAVSDLITGAQFAVLTRAWREASLPLPLEISTPHGQSPRDKRAATARQRAAPKRKPKVARRRS